MGSRIKKISRYILVFAFLLSSIQLAWAQTISNINLSPSLDISYFDNYTISADISPIPSIATVELKGINGNEAGSEWNYYADGTQGSLSFVYDLSLASDTLWQKTLIRPDQIYPEILYAPASVTNHEIPVNINVRRQNYQILHFINPFIMEDEMNFWVEINASPVAEVNSADLLVYLVESEKDVSFFETDWRNNSTDVELIGTIDRNAVYNHSHSDNSKHYLLRLSTNADKTVGTKNLNINNDFWLILYNTSPNINRGWNLKYHQSSVCGKDNSDWWYRGNQTGWTVASQLGCPDVHVHFARRGLHADGVKATITADSVTQTQNFSFAPLPNLKPNATNFVTPVVGVYSGTFDITWNLATDPNEEVVDYNLYLVNSESVESTLIEETSLTSFSWNTQDPDLMDGEYYLKGQACDVANLCTDFYSQPFMLNNTALSIKSLSSIGINSDNLNSTIAVPGNRVSLLFSSSGVIDTPAVAFYSGGAPVTDNSIEISASGNNWIASYVVSTNDTSGDVTFIIRASDLDLEYSDITYGSSVVVNTSPSPSPSPSPTPTPVLVPSSQQAVTASAEESRGNDTCTDLKFTAIPDLFQIEVTSTTATLYYAPINGPTTNYYISYSETLNKLEHGTFTDQGQSSGVLTYTVYHLKPNTSYYFRVRGQNGCMPGDFSKTMKATTKKWFGFSRTINYRKKTFFPTPVLTINEIVPKTTQTEPEKPAEKKVIKRCFLWWCF